MLTKLDPFAGMDPYVVGFESFPHDYNNLRDEPIFYEPPNPWPLESKS